ncbi:MAG: alpha/beta family hydrolase [Hyphomicrobium sp.]
MTVILSRGPDTAEVHLLLAHGAGAPMTSPFMDGLSRLAAAASGSRDLQVHRFGFSYMADKRKAGSGRRPPPRADTLTSEFDAALGVLEDRLSTNQRVVIGGKSMGGRVASLLADRLHAEGRIAGLVVAGYPFHPVGRPESLRTGHLADLSCPTLIVQGERDPFGSRQEVSGYDLSPAIRFCWIPDGDHDFSPPARSSATATRNMGMAAAAIAEFCHALPRAAPKS